jgi:centromeric protein E
VRVDELVRHLRFSHLGRWSSVGASRHSVPRLLLSHLHSTASYRAYVRLRPAQSNAWAVSEDGLRISQISEGQPGLVNSYELDAVFDESVSNESVYENTTKHLVSQVVEGFNSTVLAYGQTSSGKTHTMQGTEEDPGIIPRAVSDLFDLLREMPFITAKVSYMEIYNEEIRDLLDASGSSAGGSGTVSIQQGRDGGVIVIGLQEIQVSEQSNVMELVRKGDAQRQVGETKMNARSSRSHAIFRLTIQGEGKRSELTLVDLAGSERIAKTGAEGQRKKEGTAINKSLLALGTVISKLSVNASHIPYRDSKLTRVLQPSLGGNAQTAVICAINPLSEHCDESHNSLAFASRAKLVINELKRDDGKNEISHASDNISAHETIKRKIEAVTRYMLFPNGGSQQAGRRRPNGRSWSIGGEAFTSGVTLGIEKHRESKRTRRATLSTAEIHEGTPTWLPEVTASDSSEGTLLERYKRDLHAVRADLKRVVEDNEKMVPVLKEAQWKNRQLEKDAAQYKEDAWRYKAALACYEHRKEETNHNDDDCLPASQSGGMSFKHAKEEYEEQIAEIQACADAASAHVQYLEEVAEQQNREKEAIIMDLKLQYDSKIQSLETTMRGLEDTCEKSKLEIDALQSETLAAKEENDALLKRITLASGTLNAMDELREIKKRHREEINRLNSQLKSMSAGSKGNERAAERAAKETTRLKNQIQDFETKLKKVVSEKSALQSEKAKLDRELRTAKASLEKLNKNAERAAQAEERRRQPIISELEETKTKLNIADQELQAAREKRALADQQIHELQLSLEQEQANNANLSGTVEKQSFELQIVTESLKETEKEREHASTMLEKTNTKLASTEDALQEANKNIAKHKEQLRGLQSDLEQNSSKIIELHAAVDALEQDKKALGDSLEAAETKIEMMDTLQLDLGAERAHVTTLQSNFEIMEKGLEDHKIEVQRLKEQLSDKGAGVESLERQVSELVAKTRELQTSLDVERQQTRKTKSLLSQAENAIEEHEATINEVHQQKVEVEEALTAMKGEAEALRVEYEKEKIAFETKHKAIEGELKAHQNRLNEEKLEEIQGLCEEIAAHKTAMVAGKRELRDALASSQNLKQEIEALREREVEHLSIISELKESSKAQANEHQASTEKEFQDLHAKLEDAHRTLEKAASRNMDLESTVESLEARLKAMEDDLEAANSAAAKSSRGADAQARCLALETELRKSKRREEKLQALQYRLQMDVKESGGSVEAFKNLRDVRSLEYELDRTANRAEREISRLKDIISKCGPPRAPLSHKENVQ